MKGFIIALLLVAAIAANCCDRDDLVRIAHNVEVDKSALLHAFIITPPVPEAVFQTLNATADIYASRQLMPCFCFQTSVEHNTSVSARM